MVFYPIWVTGWIFLWTGGKWYLIFPRCVKSSLSKFKFKLKFLWVQYLFCMVAIHLQNWCMMDFVKPVRTAAPTRNITAVTCLHVSPLPVIYVQWHERVLADFSKIIQSLWNGSLTDWDFVHSPFRLQKLVVATNLIYDNYMLWNFYSHSSHCYQALKKKTLNN